MAVKAILGFFIDKVCIERRLMASCERFEEVYPNLMLELLGLCCSNSKSNIEDEMIRGL